MIAVPVALQGLISSSLTLLDNVMVSSLSETALSAVNLGVQLFNIQWMMVFGFCTGCSTFLTQFWGAEDTRSIRKVIGFASVNTLALSLLLFLLSTFFPRQIISLYTSDPLTIELGVEYLRTAAVNFLLIGLIQPLSTSLRATQQTRIPMYISVGAFFIDVVFNYLLIFGKFGFPRLEVKGAALATVIARIFEAAMMLIMVFVRKNPIKGPIHEFFAFDKSFAVRVYKNSTFTTLNETLWSGANSAMAAAYGHINTVSYAAYSAAHIVMGIFLMCMFSIGDASLILVGAKIGEGKREEALGIAKKLLRLAVIFGILAGIMIGIFSRVIIRLFTLSPEGYSIAQQLFYINAVFCPIYLVNGVLVSGLLRAGGDTRFAALTEILIMWLTSVPLAFIGAMWLKLPIAAVVLMTQVESVIKIFVRSGKWLNYMIEGM